MIAVSVLEPSAREWIVVTPSFSQNRMSSSTTSLNSGNLLRKPSGLTVMLRAFLALLDQRLTAWASREARVLGEHHPIFLRHGWIEGLGAAYDVLVLLGRFLLDMLSFIRAEHDAVFDEVAFLVR